MMKFEFSAAFAEGMDREDPLSDFRQAFHIPRHGEGELIYFCGNSLGLQPRAARDFLEAQLSNWQQLAVEGWFEGEQPWMYYHREMQTLLAPLVGARPLEVIPMNTLTVNIHLMLVSFFRPSGRRRKILMEAGAFPSDQYAIESQLRFHGLDPAEDLIEVFPEAGEELLQTEAILRAIRTHGDEIALVFFSGINYYTGQFYDLEAITRAAHEVGAVAGFDLAHAAGNVPLQLHDWNVDFACWCSYKYMNSGPGGVSGLFIHEKHFDQDLNRFAGWWGYDASKRFRMEQGFRADEGAAGWQISCTQVFPLALYKASLELFHAAGGMEVLRAKSLKLTAYLEFIIDQVNASLGEDLFRIISPRQAQARGAQLSLVARREAKLIFQRLNEAGIRCDWREPDVIRVSPVPLYNRFSELFQFGKVLIDIAREL